MGRGVLFRGTPNWFNCDVGVGINIQAPHDFQRKKALDDRSPMFLGGRPDSVEITLSGDSRNLFLSLVLDSHYEDEYDAIGGLAGNGESRFYILIVE
ncbi:hypothetical protein RIB2604_00100530 [Aspergillus luchuensis]|uniref:Uncharacterized protein n=1 Tax=Aspergillus kawachii TaxID=1069201 RepID=A0A146EXM0_ASPKA|nr:hypothetical protein RIB2604_00100530 [Aspergillus luchuensis]